MSDSEQVPPSAPAPRALPDAPNLEWLRKQARRRLAELRRSDAGAKLADAQFRLAREHGFSSWRALKAHVDALTVDGQLFAAARDGSIGTMRALLDRHPDRLHARDRPYAWTLLHHAAFHGHLPVVDLLLARGLDVDAREKGDHTVAMHWAAAAGHLPVVQRLADAGGDVIGQGDDHALEIIGWATCWERPHADVAEELVRRGARHHAFSAVALERENELRRMAAEDPSSLERRMSRHEDRQLPLHFAVRTGRPRMVALLLELGADPLGTDASGFTAAAYATAPGVDQAVLEAIRARGGADLFTLLALGEVEAAERRLREEPGMLDVDGSAAGALHLAAKRNDAEAARWLLAHGADPDARWPHWSAEVTPLHLAVLGDHAEMVRLLLDAGADPAIRDSEHDSDAFGWAEFFRRDDILRILQSRG